jgi:hypothetical protein
MTELTPALKALLDDPGEVQDPVAVLHWGKSGSYLLCSLLDGHAQTLQNPFEAMFSYHYREGLLFTARANGRVCAEEVLPWAEANYDAIAGIREPALEARTAFLGFLRQILSRRPNGMGRADLIKAVHVAYAAARGHPLTTTRPVLVWNLHLVQSAELLLSLYPAMRFVTTVRFPEKALDSELFTFCFQQQNFAAAEIVRRNLASIFERDTPLTADHVAVRFEDMHCEPEATTRALAAWIGIDWAPSMLISSIDGEAYYFSQQYVHTGRNDDPRGLTGFSPERARDRSFSILSLADRLVLRLALRRLYVGWGYGSEAPAWPATLQACILGAMAWLPMRPQRAMFSRDWAAAGSLQALLGVSRYYLAEIVPTARLLGRKSRSQAPLLPILTPGNRGVRTG